MKFILYILFLLLAISTSANSQNYMIKAYYDSDSLKIEWNNFLNNPSSENALKVYDLLPAIGHVRKKDSDLELEENIYKNLKIIEKEIYKENQNCIKLAFRLFTISDGAFSEVLNIILGKLININPEIFLQELKTHYHLVSLTHLVSNFRPEYVDDFPKQLVETERRIAALKSVNIKDLLDYKEKSIEELTKNKQSLQSLISNIKNGNITFH